MEKREGLLPTLDMWDAAVLVVGNVLGSGIFLVARDIAAATQSAQTSLLVWVAAGALSLCGALAYAELGAMMPRAGGQYVYLREAYGPLSGFLFGWAQLLIIQTGSVAAVAVGFGIYLGEFLPLGAAGVKIAAVLLVVLLTAINCFGVRPSMVVLWVFTTSKVMGIAGIVALAILLGKGSWERFSAGTSHSGTGLGLFGVALVAALWAFDGWNNVSFTAGEVKNPQRNLPGGLLLGTLLVTLIYLAANAAYLYVLPLERVAASERVAGDVVAVLLGAWGQKFLALLVMCSTLSCAHGLLLAGSRVYYAMASDGLFFRWVAAVHPRFRTPHISLLVQGAWTCGLIMSGRYDQLFTFVIFAAWMFYALTALSVIVLRRRHAELDRPYRTPLYPWLPLAFTAAGAWIVLNTLAERPWESLAGLGILAAGLPAYAWWQRALRVT